MRSFASENINQDCRQPIDHYTFGRSEDDCSVERRYPCACSAVVHCFHRRSTRQTVAARTTYGPDSRQSLANTDETHASEVSVTVRATIEECVNIGFS